MLLKVPYEIAWKGCDEFAIRDCVVSHIIHLNTSSSRISAHQADYKATIPRDNTIMIPMETDDWGL